MAANNSGNSGNDEWERFKKSFNQFFADPRVQGGWVIGSVIGIIWKLTSFEKHERYRNGHRSKYGPVRPEMT
jgi:hypothetical protein